MRASLSSCFYDALRERAVDLAPSEAQVSFDLTVVAKPAQAHLVDHKVFVIRCTAVPAPNSFLFSRITSLANLSFSHLSPEIY
jgi:hypothetical protein